MGRAAGATREGWHSSDRPCSTRVETFNLNPAGGPGVGPNSFAQSAGSVRMNSHLRLLRKALRNRRFRPQRLYLGSTISEASPQTGKALPAILWERRPAATGHLPEKPREDAASRRWPPGTGDIQRTQEQSSVWQRSHGCGLAPSNQFDSFVRIAVAQGTLGRQLAHSLGARCRTGPLEPRVYRRSGCRHAATRLGLGLNLVTSHRQCIDLEKNVAQIGVWRNSPLDLSSFPIQDHQSIARRHL